MNLKRMFKQFDYVLLGIICMIFVLGIVTIASATDAVNIGVTREVKMQIVSFFLGLSVIFVLQFIDYEVVGEFYKPLYVLGIVLILMVYVPGLGIEKFNSRRWINLIGINVQTSELAKITYILFFAKFLERIGGVKKFTDILKCGLVMAPYFLIVLKQPDLGTSLVFVFVTFGMMLVSGLKYRYIALGLAVLMIATPIVYPHLKPHQKLRIEAYLNPDDMSYKGNYQVLNSKVTIGSGQMYGKGVFKGVYHRLNYLPVQESDFIFPVFVEETGFVGGIALIGLYLLFLMRLIAISFKVKDAFGTYIVIGFTFMFAFQIIENIAMTMGKLPVTGITLPFFSYGSTALVTSLTVVAIVESIHIRRKKGAFSSNSF
ncbi:FtsW/RodA/SpoVE family cell cycle protein [Fusibacter sp. JL298sf-3]